MKLLVFHIGQDRYGLRLRAVRQVLPLLELKRLPLAPAAVAGLMNLHGEPVPVIDLARLGGAEPSAPHFDTRIVVVDYHAPDGGGHALGLMAERVLGVREVDETRLADSGVRAAPFLGGVAGDDAGLVQLVEVERLLPPDLRAALFQAHADDAADGAP
ncbi:chemotaxis protein CheW [Pseudoduganella namucuonensis]|uniref:Chemotaxis-related protein WspB n=1 Tax=Pseudoduganella namucuonensis TaxID=1035707 RepID=A0A1I7M6D1_9BURK|nr:chemotaxis protein CheW [Pseudoduganella namucuonensis]SFV17488.1 chemotaxis-related protein WspB [Pseudoduganella namucuonensis]